MNEHSQRIVAAMIAGGASLRAHQLQKCIESVSPHVDHIVIAYNGEGAFPLEVDFLREHRVSVRKFPWEKDFAKARNQSFDMAKEHDPDWIFWIDADDVLVDGQNLRPMISGLGESVTGVFLRYDYLVDERDEPLIQQWRERLMSTRTEWKWKWPIHEVCHSRPGEHYSRKDDVRVAHQKTADEDSSKATRARNRELLLKAASLFPDEPRFLYYIANESFAAAQGMEPSLERDELLSYAIEHYKEFIGKTPWNDDAYLANCNMAECFRTLGEYNRAMDVDLQSFKLYPTWPHAYIGLANSALKLGDPERAGWWADLCLSQCEAPETTQVFEPRLLTFHPYLLRGIAKEHKQDFTGALTDYRIALKADFDNEIVLEKIAQLEEVTKQVEQSKQQYDDGGELWRQQRRLYYGTTPEKSIAFLTTPLFEPWQPTLEASRGAGGAETCIMRLAPRFARDGWRVVVFGTPEMPGVEQDGVEYYPVQDWDPNESFHTVVASRAPDFFDARINAEVKLLWMHDVNVGPDWMSSEWGDRLRYIDRIICLTEWHARHQSNLYKIPLSKFSVVPNGFELGNFADWDANPSREPRFIYSSSPDRGLDVALRLWPGVKEIVPDAELHIYYGWAAIDRIIAAAGNERQSYLANFKMEIQMAAEAVGGEKAGIVWHDRVPQAQLAKAQMNARYWFYPTYFCETFCITALESQAAGMLPITSDLAALRETVIAGDLRVPGAPNNEAYGKAFLERVRYLEKIGDLGRREYQTAGRMFAENFSWDNVYTNGWARLIASIADQKVAAA